MCYTLTGQFFQIETMATTGRKMDAIWGEFEKIAANKAKCRSCGYECAPLVDRLKKHYYKVHQLSGTTNEESSLQSTPGPSTAKQPRISDFAVKTTPEQKARFDKEVPSTLATIWRLLNGTRQQTGYAKTELPACRSIYNLLEELKM